MSQTNVCVYVLSITVCSLLQSQNQRLFLQEYSKLEQITRQAIYQQLQFLSIDSFKVKTHCKKYKIHDIKL